MRSNLILLIVLLLAGRAGAATYYVSPTGSNTSPYDTWAKAANLPETAVTAGNTDTGGEGPHLLLIGPGSYSSSVSLSDADWSGATVFGVSAAGVAASCNASNYTTYPAAKSVVTITKTGNTTINLFQANITVKNISCSVSGAFDVFIVQAGATGCIIDNVYSFDAGRYTLYLLSTSTVVTDSLISGAAGTYAVYVTGGSTATISSSIILNSVTNKTGTLSAFCNAGTDLVTLNNCIVGGSAGSAVQNTGTGTTTANNCIFLGGTAASSLVKRAGGTVNLTTNLLMADWTANHTLTEGTINTDSGNLTNVAPRFVRHQRSGIIVPAVDDTFNLDYAELLEPELAARGMGGALYVSGKDMTDTDTTAALAAMVSRGTISVGCHGWSTSLLSTTGNIYAITKAGKTINVDRTANTITISDTGTVASFKAKTLAAIKTELQALGCTVGNLPAGLTDTCLGECMTDSSGAQASPYTPQLLIDATDPIEGFFKVEIVDAKAAMEANITGLTAVKSFATSGGAETLNSRAAVQAAGFLGCRNIGSTQWPLASTNIFAQGYWLVNNILTNGSPDTATLQARARTICEFAAQHGAIIHLLAHTADECSIAQWQTILDVFATYSGEISVLSHDAALAVIRDGGLWSTADNITYTRTWTDLGDYHLQSGSHCINAGTDVGLTTDYEGNTVPSGSAVDIGAYEYQWLINRMNRLNGWLGGWLNGVLQ